MIRGLLVPPVTAFCVLSTALLDHGMAEGLKEYRKWSAVWTNPKEGRQDDFQLMVTQTSFFLPAFVLIGLNIGVLLALEAVGVTFADSILNGVIFWPLLVFAYAYLFIKAIEPKKGAIGMLPKFLNSFVEILLLVILCSSFSFIDWIGNV